ncbi:restriction endonuclease subunit S [Eggerthella sinensis]|uniref:restriction endonuclease subunit S n=1 Tax=Eggerthella sinensis TaxID=242230 RepID=UPI00266CB094|nr:restriction endonuclease subunit S [Eggerthella sinensis]
MGAGSEVTFAWEQRKLGEIGTTFAGLSGKTKEDFGHGDAWYITYMNVFSNPISAANGIENIEIDGRQNKVQYGDVLFTTSSETAEEVAMSSVWLSNRENVYLNSFCFGWRPAIEVQPLYLAYMLRSFAMRKKLTLLAQGISRYNISKIKVMEIAVPLPRLDEQARIGSFFRDLDALITLHQRKPNCILNAA